MGILQGDSPTPGPAMYWHPYHTEEPSARMRTAEASLGDDYSNNNNDVKMMGQHQLAVGTVYDPSVTFQQSHHHHQQQQQQQHTVKQERTEVAVDGEAIKTEDESGDTTKTSQSVVCAGCSFRITDRYYLMAVDKAWHSECLRCDECRRPLDSALSCFARQSRIYCREDYYRLFGGRKQCAKCCEVLQADELVMRGRDHLFHTRCFSCHVCQTHLTKGSTFGMVGSLIFCQAHYRPQQQFADAEDNAVDAPVQPPAHDCYTPYYNADPYGRQFGAQTQFYDPRVMQPQQQQQQQQQQSSYNPIEAIAPNNGKLYDSQVTSSPKNQRSRNKRRNSAKSEAASERDEDSYMAVDGMMDTSQSSLLNGPGVVQHQAQVGQQQPKTKRLRTSFKHHQLRMLKSYFATNHNPDAKDLKQLSQKTTLSKRVLQVWFQNARAKWRRLVQKNESNGTNGHLGNASSSSQHNLSTSSNCSGSGNETGSPIPVSSASPAHHAAHHMIMSPYVDHQHQQHHGMLASSRSRMSVYDDMSLSGCSSVASVGFPSPL